jgi:hypothetical protein
MANWIHALTGRPLSTRSRERSLMAGRCRPLHAHFARHALLAALLVIAGAAAAFAQDDPPGRVARLNYISGQVSFRPASLDDWGVATVNYPLTTGDHLWTEPGARAELHLGPAVIRLASETAFAFLNLDGDVVQARVAEGTIHVRVREMASNETYEIDTPNAAIAIVRPGTYVIEVMPDGDATRLTVRSGLAQVNGNTGGFSVYAGDSAEIGGTEEMSYDIGRAQPPDVFERWCQSRDVREDNRAAARYVSTSMVGYEDLDDYGTWDYVPEYGWAWQPTMVAADWAPYRYGHWNWVRPWGWTWVDDARWGFAPFHYGRWAHHHDRWMWVPGRYVARPVWAPALVGFVGGLDWSFTFSLGARPAVGWFPLGPGEAYCPSYHVSPAYLRNVNAMHVNVNVMNTANINVAHMRYANRDVAGAMTVVPREQFVGSQPVQRVAVAVPRAVAQQTPVVGHAVAVPPEARSIIGYRPSAVPRPPAAAIGRAVVAWAQPPAEVTRTNPVVPLGAAPRARTGARADARAEQAAPARRAVDGVSVAGESPADRRDERAVPRANPDTAGAARDSGNWRSARSAGAGEAPQVGGRATTSGSRPVESRRPVPRGVEQPAGNTTQPATAPSYERPAGSSPSTPRGNERPADNSAQPTIVPRYGRPGESSRPVPRGYERSAGNSDRPASAPRYEPQTREASPTAEQPAPSARSRGDERAQEVAPQRAARPGASGQPERPPAARPEQGGERKPPSSGGRGGKGQSEGSARRGRG